MVEGRTGGGGEGGEGGEGGGGGDYWMLERLLTVDCFGWSCCSFPCSIRRIRIGWPHRLKDAEVKSDLNPNQSWSNGQKILSWSPVIDVNQQRHSKDPNGSRRSHRPSQNIPKGIPNPERIPQESLQPAVIIRLKGNTQQRRNNSKETRQSPKNLNELKTEPH